MSNTDRVEWRLLDTDLVTQKCILPVIEGHIYFEHMEPGSGEVKIPLDSTAATLISSGMFIMIYYRGSARGGFFVDNIKKIPASGGEGEARWMSISGRGSMALLDDCIVYPAAGSTDTERKFPAAKKGAVLDTLINEGFARGWGTSFDWDFTGSVDSNSVAWTDNEDINVSVGQSLLDILRNFASTGAIEFSMEYVLFAGNYYWRLHAYSTAIGSNLSTTVFMRIGSNCQEVSEDEHGDNIRNAYLVKFRDGYTVSTDAASISARRRRETLLNLALAQSGASAQTFASAKLSQTKNPQTSFSVRVYDGVKPFLFVDYNLGDTITVDRFGSQVNYRVLGAQVDFRGDEYGNVVLNLNSLHYENDLKMNRDLDYLMKQWSTAHDADQQEIRQWLSLGQPNGEVFATHHYGGTLYVGGTFTAITGRLSPVYNVAAYTISTGAWSNAGSIADIVLRITDVSGTLYAAAGNNGVYQYSGGVWSNVGTVTGGGTAIRAMISDGSNLYIGGAFSGGASIGGATINSKVGKYNGSAWSAVGTAIIGRDVHSLAYYNGTIFAGRNAVVSTSSFQYFDGSAWIDKFTLTARVSAQAIAGDDLYLHHDGGAGAGTISVWNGISASPTTAGTIVSTQEGTPQGFPALAAFLSDVYFGAEFTSINGVTGFNNITRYSGGQWNMLGSGFSIAQPGGSNDDKINALSVVGDDLYAGGLFTTADGKSISNLAVWITDFQSLIDHLSRDSQFDLAAAIHGATASAITDNDEMGFWEDVSNALRKITWANIKATLKTYFDTLYAAIFTSTDVTVTTSNVSAVEQRTYNLTIAGLTANRNFILPAPSAAGKRITVNLIDGDDTYFIILIGDTSITINGGSSATEFHRIQTKGRSITFESTSTTNWEAIAGADEFVAAMGLYSTPPFTASGNIAVSPMPGPIKLTEVDIAYYNFAPVSGTQYWTFTLSDLPTNTTICTANTSVSAAWTHIKIVSFSAVDFKLSDVGFGMFGTKVSTTGNLFAYVSIKGRLC